jgi:tetratricopeptide (TPR) repeat protein
MLTLTLTLNNRQVTVCANEAQSHSFSLQDLRLNDAELKAIVLKPRLYGSRLFQALFKEGSAAKTAFDELSKQSARTIVLVLDSPELDGVAWEYAYNEVKQEYVVEDCAFTRALPESERPPNGRLKESVERVSLLFIPANPLVDLNAEPMRALDVDGEWREITRHITASHAPFDLLQLRPATPEQLQTSIARFRDGLAVHFSGHGAAMKDGTILLFERENGASNPLGTQEFIRAVKDKAEIVFLSACQSAAAEKTEFGNLARGLVKSGVPFALGMQFNLPDPFAPVISGQFYNWLAQGHAIPEATMQARRAVKRENEFFVGMIALYAAHPDETGKLNWRGSGTSLAQTFRPADVSDLPSPASGLIGRQHELMRIGTQLIEEKKPLTVTLHGAGGIGKTALLWQSLLRFAPSFELTLALALDPLPSLESILGRIERFLGLPSPCANETKERETLICERLTSKRTLLGLDNFETLNYASNEKGSDEEKTSKSLHTFFKSLAANGVILCVTSREVTNLPGETIEDIQGLTNENGGRLFQENVVRQKDEIYIEKTQQVSEMVGGHPLALRLLASAFDDQVGTSLDQYIEDLQSHLPKARDKWTEEDRHESLRASFDFTMRNLVKTEEGKELQVALSRLSVFIGFFADFIAAPVLENRAPAGNEDFEQMRPRINNILNVLWKRGLLERVEFLLEKENSYIYRLCPVLRIFAKDSETADARTIQENYWLSIKNLAYEEAEWVNKNPLMAQIAFHAMPDLLNAAEAKNDEDAALMQLTVSRLLEQFGLYDDALQLLEKSFEIRKKIKPKDRRICGDWGKGQDLCSAWRLE